MSKLNEQLQGSWSKIPTARFAPIVLLLLILVLCWKLASLFWWCVAPPQAVQVEQVQLGAQQPVVPNISGFALFQQASQTAHAADANLNLQLQGVMLGSSGSRSSAVIKVNEIADRYVVGQSLAGTSYQLAEVYWDHVVLSQTSGGRKELGFKGLETLDQPMTTSASTQPNLAQFGAANAVTNTASTANAAAHDSGTSNQRALGQAIDQIQNNREQYLKQMGVNPAGVQGYEVSDQTPAALRSQLGLRTGDRILSLNGQTVGQGQNEAQLLEQVKKEGKVKIEIKRGDQVMTFQQDL